MQLKIGVTRPLRQTAIAFNLITMTAMKTLPIRLTPGQDLRAALEAQVLAQNCRAAFVLSGIGSLPWMSC